MQKIKYNTYCVWLQNDVFFSSTTAITTPTPRPGNYTQVCWECLLYVESSSPGNSVTAAAAAPGTLYLSNSCSHRTCTICLWKIYRLRLFSRWYLNEFIDGASTSVWDKLFHLMEFTCPLSQRSVKVSWRVCTSKTRDAASSAASFVDGRWMQTTA